MENAGTFFPPDNALKDLKSIVNAEVSPEPST